ncbi:MAG: ABC transporter substrate-binding protein [Firmicutes bacterium]|nr:ABC transporter substrate-binding protein [Bacillota bacterium]
MNKSFRHLLFAVCLIALSFAVIGCGSSGEGEQPKETLVFADAGWDSIRFHNDVARLIVENGFGYQTDVIPGSTPATFTGLRNGDIDIYMEAWKQNIIETYQEGIEKGEIVEVSVNFDDNAQGLYVPTFVIEGDPARGIEPMAPELEYVEDLPEYWELFKDPEQPSKGRIYGSIPGWAADEILHQKYETYGLDETYNYFRPGSDTALAAAISTASEEGKPFVGYYWEPTWISGKYDITLLKEEEYSDEKWNNGYACEWPGTDVTIVVNSSVHEKAPEVVDFLENYKTSSKLTAEALAFMQDNDAGTEDAAKWFLQEREDVWTSWVSEEVAQKVKESL